MIFFLNININKIIITDSTFSRVLKIFIIFFSHQSSLLKCFFITALQFAFFDHTANKIVSLPKHDLKGLLNLSSMHTNL